MKWIQLFILPLLVGVNCSFIKRRVIVDTDAGADDALAISLLLKSSNVQVEAITTVTGNTGAHNVTLNVLKILSVLNKQIPVYEGSENGLIKTVEMEYYFGYDGFGDFDFKGDINYTLVQEDHPAVAIVNLVKTNPGQLTLICLGPLTNIALAVKLYPNLVDQVKEIVMVGGSYTGIGNVKPGVEFNMYGDPEAAALFFLELKAQCKVKMIPLEVLEQEKKEVYNVDWELFFSQTDPLPQFLSKVWRYKKGQMIEPGDGLAVFLALYDPIPSKFIARSPQVEYQGSDMVRGLTIMGEGNTVEIYQINENSTISHLLVQCLLYECNVK